MIRLTNQFDRPGARPTVASPKSHGSCCCCCCCVVTLVGSSVLTARATARSHRKRAEAASMAVAPAPLPSADSGYREAPLPPAVEPVGSGTKWVVLAALLLPLALSALVAGASMHSMGDAGWTSGALAGLLIYFGGLGLLNHKAGLSGTTIALLALLTPIAAVVEAVVWVTVIFAR